MKSNTTIVKKNTATKEDIILVEQKNPDICRGSSTNLLDFKLTSQQTSILRYESKFH